MMSQHRPTLKDDGYCPRCGAQAIATGAKIEGKEGIHGSNRIPIDERTTVTLDNYVCLDCGYTESYISDRGLLNRIARQWQKVQPEEQIS